MHLLVWHLLVVNLMNLTWVALLARVRSLLVVGLNDVASMVTVRGVRAESHASVLVAEAATGHTGCDNNESSYNEVSFVKLPESSSNVSCSDIVDLDANGALVRLVLVDHKQALLQDS